MSNWGHVTPGVVALAGSHNSQEHLWICFNCRARPRFFFFFPLPRPSITSSIYIFI
jgi:hypothetical protein